MAAEPLEIITSRNDKRQYRRVVLPNELQALLISDPETDKAAAAMSVHVGSWSDPEGLEGLAHFLEHMLFFSSEKYPVEDSYQKYITEHGGSSNAYTSEEFTNYHFDVTHIFFEEALDRFAQFFICPLMSSDATMREIKAVDSEHSKNLTSDLHRMYQIKCSVSSKDHPYHKFGCGNMETLYGGPSQRGIDTREELLKFYHAYYSSNLMRLVLYGRESVDELQHLAEDKFSNVKNTNVRAPRFHGQPCLEEHVQVIVKGVPLREGHTLELAWQVPSDFQNYMVSPCGYLSSIIGHEAENSLFSLLKSLGWANSLLAGPSDNNLEFAFFSVVIELTDLGQDHMYEVVSFVFQYICVLATQGVSEWNYEEQRVMQQTEFDYQEKTEPLGYVTSLCTGMQMYPPRDWLRGGMLQAFDKQVINSVLEILLPENVRIFWWSKQFQGKTTEIEPWYGTFYTVEKIDGSWLKDWGVAIPDSRLHLPVPNIFIPTEFSLKTLESKVKHPVLLRKTTMSRVWYKPDSTFLTPKAYVRFDFNCPESSHTPEAHILSLIFLRLLLDYLNEYAYYAEVAGLGYNVWRSTFGFQVYIAGYNHKLRVLAEKIIEKVVNFEVKEDRFFVMKEKITKGYLNTKYDQPYQQASYYLGMMLNEKYWDIDNILEILPDLEPQDLLAFAPRFLSRIFFESYIGGNFTSEEAQDIASQIEHALHEGTLIKTRAPFSSEHVGYRILRLEQGTGFYYPRVSRNNEDENCAIQVYFQIGHASQRISVLRKLFEQTASQEFFRVLRTVEQLGYLVCLYSMNDYDIVGVSFTIQSKVKDPTYLDQRVEAFLEWFETYLQEMTEEEFKRHVMVLKQVILEKHKNIWEEGGFFWSQIEGGTLMFDWPELQVAELERLKKQDLLWFFEEFLKVNAPKRKKLSIQVFASSHLESYQVVKGEKSQSETRMDLTCKDVISGKPEVYENMRPNYQRIDNIFNFKRSQSYYGSQKGGLHRVFM